MPHSGCKAIGIGTLELELSDQSLYEEIVEKEDVQRSQKLLRWRKP